MNSTLIKESINKEKIQLSLFQNLEYYRVCIILICIAIISFTNGFKSFSFSTLNSVNITISIICMILSLTSFLYQKSRLKFISIETNQNNFPVFENIIELAKQRNWEIELVEKNALIIKTTQRFATSKMFISKSGGEKIYVFLKLNKILLRSIFDLKKAHGFVVSSGENNENEQNILQKIKPAANKC